MFQNSLKHFLKVSAFPTQGIESELVQLGKGVEFLHCALLDIFSTFLHTLLSPVRLCCVDYIKGTYVLWPSAGGGKERVGSGSTGSFLWFLPWRLPEAAAFLSGWSSLLSRWLTLNYSLSETYQDPVGALLSTDALHVSCFLFVGNRLYLLSLTFPEFQRADSNSCLWGKEGTKRQRKSSQETKVDPRAGFWFLLREDT